MPAQRSKARREQIHAPPLKYISREAQAYGGIDIGGKNTEVRIRTKDGRTGRAVVPTFQKSEGMPVGEILTGLVGSTVHGVQEAARNGGIEISEIDALGFGAPGAYDPQTGMFKLTNITGETPVDLTTPLTEELRKLGFRGDAVTEGGNDCDVAAFAKNLGEVVVVQQGAGEQGVLNGLEKSIYLLLGTGIGGGVAFAHDIDRGATGAMEIGHGEVGTPTTQQPYIQELQCGCKKPHDGTICVEAVASTTGQENLTRAVTRKHIMDGTVNPEELKLLLERTLEWNQAELKKEGISGGRTYAMQRSAGACTAIIQKIVDKKLTPDDVETLDFVTFDAATVDRLAGGEKPQVEIAAEVMRISGEHFGRFLRTIVLTQNPKQIVIGGGGGRTFKYGDAETNPFWAGMMSQLSDEYDFFGSLRKTWIVAAVGDENLGIDGSSRLAVAKYESG